MWRALAIAALVTLWAAAPQQPAFALQPNEILKDESLEKRARKLSAGLRCLVCQNQSIDDSDAPLAKDLRVLVRERLVKGDSDEQVMKLVVDRYGEFVLLNPRLNTGTLILWLATPLILLAALAFMYSRYRRGPASAPQAATQTALSEEEQARLKRLLDDEA